jgi:hypothetical protein
MLRALFGTKKEGPAPAAAPAPAAPPSAAESTRATIATLKENLAMVDKRCVGGRQR